VKSYEEPLPNRNRSRYLFASTAFTLEPGQVTLSQTQVFATLVEVGISDSFSFQLGTSVPAFFLGGDGINGYAAVKAATAFHKWVHAALELKLLALGLWTHQGPSTAVPAAGVVAVTVTIGSEDLNLTISGGPTFNFAQLSSKDGQVIGLPLATLSGFVRVHTNVGLVTENWIIPNVDPKGHWFAADALAARIFFDRFAVDLGIMLMPTQFVIASPVPAVLPWLNFSYHFT
jgi:hypothetical protein